MFYFHLKMHKNALEFTVLSQLPGAPPAPLGAYTAPQGTAYHHSRSCI